MGKYYDRLYDATARRSPPGMDLKGLERSFWGSIAVVTVSSLGMGIRLMEYILAVAANRKNLDIELAYARDVTMLPFSQFYRVTFWCGVLGIWMILTNVLFHYLYFRQESNSRYVMKRIPDPWELHRRCWSVPLTGAGILVVFLILLYIVFCWVYFRFSPEGSIPAQTLAFFWRYVP